MSYNLLFDTRFTDKQSKWKFINCSYDNGILISTDKVFGIEQEIVLPDITRLYFRVKYLTHDSNISKVLIGIQNDKVMSVTRHYNKPHKERRISIVEDTKQEKVKVHIIFESLTEENKVEIKGPLLCDLNRLHKSTWLKFLLDHTISYRFGYSYKNLLPFSEVTPNIFNFDRAKIGSIISTDNNLKLKIPVSLEKGKRYLIKLDYAPINDLGKVYINYGVMKSIDFGKEQLYLLFKAGDTQDFNINIKPNDVLPYQINLKHLMLIETEGVGFDMSDIPYLPFV